LQFSIRETAAGYFFLLDRTNKECCPKRKKAATVELTTAVRLLKCEWVFPVLYIKAPAAMPGDALLFQRLSGSTIGAIRFHGRVRDGIGWVTDAMVTKQ
jgi:hypothetical protein